MADIEFYRGGDSLVAKPTDVEIDSATGLVQTVNGVSVSTRPDKLSRFGVPHRVTKLPPELAIVQVGRNRHHYEIVPTLPMTMDEYQSLLERIVLVPTPPAP
jgi:hypothetical protein